MKVSTRPIPVVNIEHTQRSPEGYQMVFGCQGVPEDWFCPRSPRRDSITAIGTESPGRGVVGDFGGIIDGPLGPHLVAASDFEVLEENKPRDLVATFSVALDASVILRHAALLGALEGSLPECGQARRLTDIASSAFRRWLSSVVEHDLSRPMFEEEEFAGESGFEWSCGSTPCTCKASLGREPDEVTLRPARGVRVRADMVKVRSTYSIEEPEWNPTKIIARFAVERFYELGDADPHCTE